MFTYSRAIIYRIVDGAPKNIHLWMMLDGYFTGVGNILCLQLRELLQKHSRLDLINIIENLNISDKTDDDNQLFNPRKLCEFIEGSVTYKNDPREDVYYSYEIDFYNGWIIGEDGSDDIIRITFEQILEGVTFNDILGNN